MHLLCDSEAQLLSGGFRIVVSPTIAISTAVVTGLQGNNGTSIGLGVLGVGAADLGQFSGLNLSTYLATLAA
jgi:hypothetical protein